MKKSIKQLEAAFAAVEKEHTAAAETTRLLANKRADLSRQLKAARDNTDCADESHQPSTSETEN